MIAYRQLVLALRRLDIDGERHPVIAHSSLSAFGQLRGGAASLAGALLAVFRSLLVPTFTYKTMLVPEIGPANNGMRYGNGHDANRAAEFFRPRMPADPLMGIVAETIRTLKPTARSSHPILSFAGVNAGEALARQEDDDPFAPLRVMMEQEGWVLLLGVGHSANTSIHLGERLAGRKTFVRWGLTPKGVRQCAGFPSCSDGFDAIAPHVTLISRRLRVGAAEIRALPLVELIDMTEKLIREDPLALLCDKPSCPRCLAVRAEVEARRSGDKMVEVEASGL